MGYFKYADRRRTDLECAVGWHVWLRVSLMRGVRRFGVRGKLSPRYIGPFEILERVGCNTPDFVNPSGHVIVTYVRIFARMARIPKFTFLSCFWIIILIVRSSWFILFYNSLLPVRSVQHLRVGEFIYNLYNLSKSQI